MEQGFRCSSERINCISGGFEIRLQQKPPYNLPLSTYILINILYISQKGHFRRYRPKGQFPDGNQLTNLKQPAVFPEIYDKRCLGVAEFA